MVCMESSGFVWYFVRRVDSTQEEEQEEYALALC